MKISHLFFILVFAITSACASKPIAANAQRNISSDANPIEWSQPRNGVELAIMDNGEWYMLRADTKLAPLVLLNNPETIRLTVPEIARQYNLMFVINAAMFEKDEKTSVGYMRNYSNINNPKFNSKMQGYLMFHPKTGLGLPVKIGGKNEIDAYETVFQTYRMWSAEEGILWKKGARVYYRAGLVGADKEGRILFFFHPGNIDMYAFVEKIIANWPDLQGLLYLDGGTHGMFHLTEDPSHTWNSFRYLPNLLGIVN